MHGQVDEIGSFESLGTRVDPIQYLMSYPGVRMTQTKQQTKQKDPLPSSHRVNTTKPQ
jgi:hypothetical protein